MPAFSSESNFPILGVTLPPLGSKYGGSSWRCYICLSVAVQATFKETALQHGSALMSTTLLSISGINKFVILPFRLLIRSLSALSRSICPPTPMMLIWFRCGPHGYRRARRFLSNDVCTSSLAPIGMTQHVSKQDHMVCYKGAHSGQAYRDTYLSSLLPGKTSRVYKNLGMLHHFNGSNTREVQARVLSAKRGYYSMGALWSIHAGHAKPMLDIFRALIFHTLVSGLEVFVLSPSEVATLSSTPCHLGRKLLLELLLKRYRCQRSKNYTAPLTNAQVLEKLLFAPLSFELRIRRLRNYQQQLARRPANHRQVFAAMFGQ